MSYLALLVTRPYRGETKPEGPQGLDRGGGSLVPADPVRGVWHRVSDVDLAAQARSPGTDTHPYGR